LHSYKKLPSEMISHIFNSW